MRFVAQMIAGESICALCIEITMDTTTGVRFNTPKCRCAITMPPIYSMSSSESTELRS